MVHIGACLRPICQCVAESMHLLLERGAAPARFCGCRGRQARQVLADLPAVWGCPSCRYVCFSDGLWAAHLVCTEIFLPVLCSVPALSRYWGHPNLWCSTRLWVWRCVGTPQRRRLWRHTRVSSQGVGWSPPRWGMTLSVSFAICLGPSSGCSSRCQVC